MTRGYIPLNPIKPPFSYGFPMAEGNPYIIVYPLRWVDPAGLVCCMLRDTSHLWRSATRGTRPGKRLQFAIENGHRNSGFSH